MKRNRFLEQSRRDKTHEVQLTPYKRSAVWGRSLQRNVGMIAVILMVLSLIVTACSKPEKQELAGSWRWTSTMGGFAGDTFTPESEGFEAEFVFKGSTFTFYKDGKKVTSGIYHIDEDEDGGYYPYSSFRFRISIAQFEKISKATNGKISFLMDPRGIIGYISNSGADGQALHLCDDVCDGYCSTFVKKQ